MTESTLPKTQNAVQLIASNELRLNAEKAVFQPGPRQMLAKTEAVGLCFSDLKLLKQFTAHTRKAEIVTGLKPEELAEIPSYVPGDKPTVPGHEVVCRIVQVGDQVTNWKVGDRCLVQADYRQLRTPGSNAAFGYNFEGGLQEYILIDERVVVDDAGEKYLLDVPEHLGASQAALVEPWACVEDSYVTSERQTIKPGGRLAIVAETGREIKGVAESFASQGDSSGAPASITAILADDAQKDAAADIAEAAGVNIEFSDELDALDDEGCDDIVYFGNAKAALDTLNDKLAARGIMNVVLGGEKIGEKVNVGLGRIHYGMTRWIGTVGDDASVSYRTIPPDGEIRENESIHVLGAGGPMGQMHVIRNLCSGVEGVSVVGTDLSQERLDALEKKARAIAEENGVEMKLVNTKETPLEGLFSYHAIMAPISAIVAGTFAKCADGAIINVFAGIPAPEKYEIDLDTFIEKRIFLFGTSGSTVEDMRIVLDKVTEGSLKTNASVDAVSGIAGAVDGIRAVEANAMAGKIIVYPMVADMPLTRLSDLAKDYPTVAEKLDDGQWTKAAEDELVRLGTAS